jgi:hypothetical protein
MQRWRRAEKLYIRRERLRNCVNCSFQEFHMIGSVGEVKKNIFKVRTEKTAVLMFNSVAAEKLLSEDEILIGWALHL